MLNLWIFTLVSLGLFALIQFVAIPSTENRINIDRTATTVGRSGVLALLGVFRGLFLISSVTAVLVLVVVLLLQLRGGTTTSEVAAAISSLQAWRVRLLGFGTLWGSGVTAVLILALGIYARRSGKRRMVKIFREAYDREYTKVTEEYEAGRLEELPPTQEMLRVRAALAEAYAALDRLGDGAKSGVENLPEWQKLAGDIYLLEQFYRALDVQRRMPIDFRVNPDDAALPEAHTRWEKAQTFFISRGLLASLNRGTRALYLATLILLVPSLMGVYSGASASTLNKSLIKLEQLRVQLWEKELDQVGVPARALSAEDLQVINQVSRLYEEEKDKENAQQYRSYVPRSFYLTRSVIVRDSILDSAVKLKAGTVAKHESVSKAAGLTSIERELVYAQEEFFRGKGPVTGVGKRVAVDLENIARRSPSSFMESLKGGLRSFQSSAGVRDIRNGLINHVFSVVAGNEHGELGNVLKGMHVADTTDNLKWAWGGSGKQFVIELKNGVGLDAALGNVGRGSGAWGTFGRSYEMVEVQPVLRTVMNDISKPIEHANTVLRERPPGVFEMAEKDVDMRKVAAGVDKLKKSLFAEKLPAAPEKLTACLETYTDNFPGQAGVEQGTERGLLIKEWQKGLPSEVVTRIQQEAQSSKTLFRQARSFESLQGYSKVGGIVIGREPADASKGKLDIIDIGAESSADGMMRLQLVKGDGSRVVSRPHHPGLLYNALTYAADGRPLTVTIVSATPLYERKVMLHPVLVDTELGRSMIALDQFVFQFAEHEPSTKALYKEATGDVEAQESLYQYAWARRIKVLGLSSIIDTAKFKDTWEMKQADHILQDEATLKDVERALRKPEMLGDPAHSPLTVKKEFFDEQLVKAIISAAKNANGRDRFDSELDSQLRSRLAAHESEIRASRDEAVFRKFVDRWASPAPEFSLFSGVREKAFDSEDRNLLALDGSDPRPFDFVLQIEFSSAPQFLETQEGASGYTDTNPWGFPALKEKIQDKVLAWAEAQPSKRLVLDEAAEFVMLQRLFRMGFESQLGERFPVEKLASLAEKSAPAAPSPVRTLRWDDPFLDDPNVGGADYYYRKALGNDKEGVNIRMWLLDMSDVLYPALLTDKAGQGKNVLQQVIQLRSDLKVDRDREQQRREMGAASPPAAGR